MPEHEHNGFTWQWVMTRVGLGLLALWVFGTATFYMLRLIFQVYLSEG
jgi:hypothetical protein